MSWAMSSLFMTSSDVEACETLNVSMSIIDPAFREAGRFT